MLTVIQPITTSETNGRVRTELAAMRAVATALESLPDDEARVRVVRWALEMLQLKLQESPAAEPAEAPRHARRRSGDPALAFDGVDEMFATRPDELRPAKYGGRESHREVTPRADHAADAHQPHPPAPGVTAPPKQSLGTLLQGLVDDFHQLARDWQAHS